MTTRATDTSIRSLARQVRSNANYTQYAFWVAVAIVLTGFADVLSTDLALSTGGAHEANPIIRYLQEILGPLWVAPKMLLHGVLGYMVMWYPNRPTLISMSLVSTLVLLASINNFHIYLDVIGWI